MPYATIRLPRGATGSGQKDRSCVIGCRRPYSYIG